MSAIRNKVVVITGAGSGIGRALALDLGARGARLALSDMNEVTLAETGRLAVALGAEVHTALLDVSDRAAFRAYARATVGHYGVVHQLYNNAGIGGAARPLLEVDYASFERVLNVNLWGVIYGTKEFLPHLVASGDGHVVNISSLNGFMGQPQMSAYCTSKFGVRGFTDSLRAEMQLAGHPVRVTLVHPGGVKTNIATAGLAGLDALSAEEAERQRKLIAFYNERLFRTSADDAARTIVDGVIAGSSRVLIGREAKLVDFIVRTAPAQYTRLVALWARRMLS